MRLHSLPFLLRKKASRRYSRARTGTIFARLRSPGRIGCEWDEDTCSCAAEGGHLDLLKWATAEGCEVDSWTFNVAAEGGHLEVLDALSGRSQCT